MARVRYTGLQQSQQILTLTDNYKVPIDEYYFQAFNLHKFDCYDAMYFQYDYAYCTCSLLRPINHYQLRFEIDVTVIHG